MTRAAHHLAVAVSLALLLVAGCGDDDADQVRATTTSTTQVVGMEPSDQVVEDERCDPAAAVIDDDDWGLTASLSDVDIGDGQGPSDEVLCVFTLLRPPESMDEPQERAFTVSPSGVATETKLPTEAP